MIRHPRALLVLLALGAACLPCLGEEGLWPIRHVPQAYLRDSLGFAPDNELLQTLTHACVHFPSGGSGVLVSPEGLILTNLHVAMQAAQEWPDASADGDGQGFLAAARDGELRCPQVRVEVIAEIRDITGLIRSAVHDKTPGLRGRAIETAIRAAEHTAQSETGLDARTFRLRGDTQAELHLYRTYDDVRLVFAPPVSAAMFGGYNANFEYPRWAMDCCLLRAYENGRPARTEHYLSVADKAVKPGDVLVSAGFPRQTSRRLTLDHLKLIRDVALPMHLLFYNLHELAVRDLLPLETNENADADRTLGAVQNARKALDAQFSLLLDHTFLRHKLKRQSELQSYAASIPDSRDDLSRTLHEISLAAEAVRPHYALYTVLELHPAPFGALVETGRELSRRIDRTDDATEVREGASAGDRAGARRFDMRLERYRIEAGLTALARALGGDHPAVNTLLDGGSPAERAASLLANTHLTDAAFRRKLLTAGPGAAADADDELLAFAGRLETLARGARRNVDQRLTREIGSAYSRLAELERNLKGPRDYPPADETLRVTAGRVAGYEEGRQTIGPWTTWSGWFEASKRHQGAPQWSLPKKWTEAADSIAADAELNFVATLDVVGGSSGSPVLNQEGVLIGTVFDGNRHALGWELQYDAERGRAICLHMGVVLQVIEHVYNGKELVEELRGGRTH